MEPLRVFIGYDAREAVAAYVCMESIRAHASVPVTFTLLSQNNFPEYVEGHTDGSNAFTYSRFLVPYLCGYSGSAVFLDGDMILREDIKKLWDQRPVGYHGVKVVKHEYQTKYRVKYLGQRNDDYPCKNWSSVVLWDCAYQPNKILTPKYVASMGGDWLHRFRWLKPSEVGELSPEWNWLVREYEPNPNAKLYHYTVGTPCFEDYMSGPEADEWRSHLRNALAPL